MKHRGLMMLVLWVLSGLIALPAQAHRPSDAYLSLRVDDTRLHGQWEIALRDLPALVDLDADRNRELTWGELSAAQPALAAVLQAHLALRADGRPCPLTIGDLLVHSRVDGRYAWFALEADCVRAPAILEIDYRLLFDVDPTHRGILVLTAGATPHSAVLDPQAEPRRFDLARPSAWRAFLDYTVEGVRHIWIGYDHILFLLALLLPAVLRYERGRWSAVDRLRPALWNVFGVVTAFTLAHSVTLTLAALEWVRLPIAWVEMAIALSVLLAALNNLRPVVLRARWMVAFGFGLIHGFGFASVLGELGLPEGARLIALVAFNVGVEVGQMAIVLVAVPAAYALRRTRFYQVSLRIGGSVAVALLALLWIAQRGGWVQ